MRKHFLRLYKSPKPIACHYELMQKNNLDLTKFFIFHFFYFHFHIFGEFFFHIFEFFLKKYFFFLHSKKNLYPLDD